MKDRFEEIYQTNEWLVGSGEGSLPVHTKGYVRFLERFLVRNRISSVVDLGCGDWQFSKDIDWHSASYLGLEIVASVVERNRLTYGAPGVRFEVFDEDFEVLPAADLLIAKDVLQHWSNATVARFLPVLGRYRHALLTNCVNPFGPTPNQDILDGQYHHIDLREAPFELNATEVFSFTNKRRWREKPRWRKSVLEVV